MCGKLIFISLFYYVFACETDEALPWRPETSLLLRHIGWNPQFYFDSPYPEIDVNFDDNFGLESIHLFGGDVIEDSDQQDNKAANIKDKLWPKGRIPYIMSDKLNEEKDAIRSAMKSIESKTCIRFVKRTTEKNYINLYKGEGCSSKVGMSGGMQKVSLGSGCYKVGKIMHELLHVIGFQHEQSRSDRDSYIDVHWENIKEGYEKNFAKLKPEQILMLTSYDYESIMHYSQYSFSKNKEKGLKTMSAKKKGVVLRSPGEKVLSKGDIQRIIMLYKC